MRVASTADEPGLVVPNAHMIVLFPVFSVPSEGIENTTLGFDPDVEESDWSRVAVLGGLETTVGITSDEACRWESVMEPSVLGQRITMGVLAIWPPKPL